MASKPAGRSLRPRTSRSSTSCSFWIPWTSSTSAVLPRLPIFRRLNSVALHPVCSAVKMGLSAKLVALAEACSDEVVVPQEAGCCAFAGDRGFLHPELTRSATASEAAELAPQPARWLFFLQPHLRDRHDARHRQTLPVVSANARRSFAPVKLSTLPSSNRR
jgi:hypothetical protein